MGTLRLIQVGLGGWGKDWAKLLSRGTVDVETVAFVDPVPAALEQLQLALNVPATHCFPTLDAAIAATDADAVLVTAALPGHVPVALAALREGKHVLVEKPFAPTVAEAEEVVAAAAEANRILMVSQNYRFYPAARTAAALIRDQTFGPVGAVNIQFRRYANSAPPEGNRHYALPHPLLQDMAIHHFDLMRFVLGQEPLQIYCHAWNPSWSHFREPAAASATISFDGGAVVSYQGSWVSTAPETAWAGEWEIECEQGVISWTGRDNFTTDADKVMVRPNGKRARKVELPPMEHFDRAGSVAAFAAAIENLSEPETSGRDNLGSLALTMAAIESAATGLPVELKR